jgi:hypothetical protein
MVNIIIEVEKLTDGSKAFNVLIGNLELNAISEEAAEKLADRLRRTIDLYTVQAVKVIDRRT